MAIIQVLQNNEQQACLKIVCDQSTDTVSIDLDKLCYHNEPGSWSYDDLGNDESLRFQQFVEGQSSTSILSAQWSGYDPDNSHFKVWRGQTTGVEDHLAIMGVVGDTCQYEFEGQEMVPDNIFGNERYITVEIQGEIILWLRIRKTGFKSLNQRYADYGAYANN